MTDRTGTMTDRTGSDRYLMRISRMTVDKTGKVEDYGHTIEVVDDGHGMTRTEANGQILTDEDTPVPMEEPGACGGVLGWMDRGLGL